GQADEIQTCPGSLCISSSTPADTCCAPRAVSETAKKPTFLRARINCPARTPGNCATNDGASEATTFRPPAKSSLTLGRSSRTCLALLGQATVQLPQSTHIAFTGHSRMHLWQS